MKQSVSLITLGVSDYERAKSFYAALGWSPALETEETAFFQANDVPGSMRDWLIAETDPPHWQAWGQLHEAVRSGRTVVPELFGMHIYDYYAAHPADLAYFSRAMGNVSALVAGGMVQHYDFSRGRHIVDVVEQMAVFCWQSWRLVRLCTAPCSIGLRWWRLHVRRSRPRTIKRDARLLAGISFSGAFWWGPLRLNLS